MTQEVTVGPTVRIEDATFASSGGPARMVLSRITDPRALADAIASAGGSVEILDVASGTGRLRVQAAPSRIVAAAGRVGGRAGADAVETAIERALAAVAADQLAWDLDPGSPPDAGLDASDDTIDVRDPARRPPRIMAIVNVTPDSFSDGGQHLDPDAAIAAALDMVEQGAEILDVGGESSRPGAAPVSADEELERVVPVIRGLAEAGLPDHVRISVDTTKADVARAAVAVGATIVNDITAGRGDDAMLETVATLDAAYVAMHMQGTPRTMQAAPTYDDVVAEVHEHLVDAVERAVAAGIRRERIAVDPGIGFGKLAAHNLELLRRLGELRSLGRPIVVGASRKSFIGAVTGEDDPRKRLEGSLAVAALATAGGAAVLRVHDVAETRRAVAVAHAVANGTCTGDRA